MTSLACATLLVLAGTSCACAFGFTPANPPCPRSPWIEAWTVLGETGVFAGYIPTFQSGDALRKEGVFAITLEPRADVVYFARSSSNPRTGYGGIIELESVAAGRYGIILSQEARLELVQHEPRLYLVAQWQVEPHHARTAEIVEGGPLTLQIRGAATTTIVIAMTRLRDRALVAPGDEDSKVATTSALDPAHSSSIHTNR